MENKESLYIKILIWGYEKSTKGFTEDELLNKFKCKNDPQLYAWYLKVFKDSPPLITHLKDTCWCLTAQGMSNAINYLALKDVQKNSRVAIWTAIIAIIIGTVASIAPSLLKLK